MRFALQSELCACEQKRWFSLTWPLVFWNRQSWGSWAPRLIGCFKQHNQVKMSKRNGHVAEETENEALGKSTVPSPQKSSDPLINPPKTAQNHGIMMTFAFQWELWAWKQKTGDFHSRDRWALKPTKQTYSRSPLHWWLQAPQPSLNIPEKPTWTRRNRKWSPRQIKRPTRPPDRFRSPYQPTPKHPKPWEHPYKRFDDEFCPPMRAVSLETKKVFLGHVTVGFLKPTKLGYLSSPLNWLVQAAQPSWNVQEKTYNKSKKPRMKPLANPLSHPPPRSSDSHCIAPKGLDQGVKDQRPCRCSMISPLQSNAKF